LPRFDTAAGGAAAAPAAAVSNLGNGTYLVTYLPVLAGRYTITITLGAAAAAGAGAGLSEAGFLAVAAPAGLSGDAGRPSRLAGPYSVLVKSGAPDVPAASLLGPATRWAAPAAAPTAAGSPTAAAAAAAAAGGVGRVGAMAGYPVLLVCV
jgi:hypothetical protein